MNSVPDVIMLCGFSGSGKTETGQILARQLNYLFTDTDDAVEQSLGKSIPEIFAQMGEAKFRFTESNVIRMAVKQSPHVISLGGGTIGDENNLEYVRENGHLVYLKVSPTTVYERLRESHFRPMLQAVAADAEDKEAAIMERITSLLGEREIFYMQADTIVDTEGKTPQDVANEIQEVFSGNGQG